MTLHIDFETRSTIDLRKAGVYVYAEHPTTDVWCAAYVFDKDPVKLWVPGDPVPPEIADAVAGGGILTAHNAAFERIIWRFILGPRYGWPVPELSQWRCTMAMALAMALPGDLDRACQAVQSPIRKDEAGHRLMMQMSSPRKASPLTWWDVPEKKERLYAYCKQDVEAERELEKRLLQLRPSEQRLWQLDQTINDRGVQVDLKLCRKATAIVDGVKEDLDRQMSKLTNFDVTRCSNRNQFASWLRAQGVPADSVAKDVLAELLARADLSPTVRKAIELRQDGSKAAASKIDALVNGTSPDGRARGLLQYHATVTGRWGGRRFQPQNLKRPKEKDMETLVAALMSGDAAYFSMLYANPLSAVGDAVRNLIIAKPGKKLVVADFSNIEGRVAAWYAGEDWKLKAFREYDAGVGPDLYKLAYHKSFGTPVDAVDDAQRQIGKVEELSLQYQGGHGAFVQMAAGYGVVPDKIAPIIKAAVPPETFEKALKKFRPQNGFGMAPETWAALRVLIDGWRAAHPGIVQAWRDLETAAKNAVEDAGSVYAVGPVKFKRKGSFLFMQLPSGRALCFPYPCIKDKLMPWTETEAWIDAKGEKRESEVAVYKPSLCYKGLDSVTNQWGEQFAYGGQLFDYVVQGTARDIMADAMFRVEAADYPAVLTVHDEIAAEVDKGFGDADEFGEIMSVVPAYAKGCPITAKGWSGDRYKKG